MPAVTAVGDSTASPTVRGYLHWVDSPPADGLVLAHGAGSDARAPLLVALAGAFAAAGIAVLRIDLPFRQARPHGPPYPASAAQDRAGLKRAVTWLRAQLPGRVFLGGVSYGGRQCTILSADEPDLAAGLLLLSYPLHAPGRHADLRTAHFPQLSTPTLFIHGTRDPFGSQDEMRAALPLLAGPHELVFIDGAGHDLGGKKPNTATAIVLEAFQRRFRTTRSG